MLSLYTEVELCGFKTDVSARLDSNGEFSTKPASSSSPLMPAGDPHNVGPEAIQLEWKSYALLGNILKRVIITVGI